MNKDELIQLRKDLLAEGNRKYKNVIIDGTTSNGIYMEQLDGEKTSSEILLKSNNSEQKAVEYYESKIEEIIRNTIAKNNDFDGIKTIIYPSFFIADEMAAKINSHCSLPLDNFDKKNVYNGYVSISFSYDFIGNDEIKAEDYLNDSDEPIRVNFLVKYEKFVELLKERGFDIDITTFDELLNSAVNGIIPEITVDLTKETKKSK